MCYKLEKEKKSIHWGEDFSNKIEEVRNKGNKALGFFEVNVTNKKEKKRNKDWKGNFCSLIEQNQSTKLS